MPKFSFWLCLIIAATFGIVVNSIENEVKIYWIYQGNTTMKLTNFGARIISLVIPDKNGKPTDIVLGYDCVEDYLNDKTYFGAIVGRVANRIGGAQFTLNGSHYKLDANENQNTLHGGRKGLSQVIWEAEGRYADDEGLPLTFFYTSRDGEEGFPGDVLVRVTYSLNPKNLRVELEAKALNKSTPVNLAQHTYWNLGGHNSGDILSDEVQIFASNFTPVNDQLIPTGEILPVNGTPYDFLKSHKIGSHINEKGHLLRNGYDINYAIDHEVKQKSPVSGCGCGFQGDDGERLKLAAVVRSKKSGIGMNISTTAPGLQFYTGNYLKNVKGKGGYIYQAHAGYCFETQGFPDSVNHPNFPSQIVKAGDYYSHETLYEFETK
ncbi:hypothetical protein ACH5RR_014326 [Cinchona calisaya]|uniref:Aldose 1-epimerase n=1 Tax=Cinchona calisaya TaxID=153742 RepID=A0ABD3A2M6_9GENT